VEQANNAGSELQKHNVPQGRDYQTFSKYHHLAASAASTSVEILSGGYTAGYASSRPAGLKNR
jgi:hypothetical protein